ncbi:VOC family protein [Solibacillus sp. FSL R5-0691]|uniref:VOC family protein n=1 Tax=Solibacillus sp. FSL R5-0691 TaxID=2921653 RepID=UPI0030D5A8EA
MYQFDHLVHFVPYPEQTMLKLQEEGLHVVPGGSHEAWGTYNTLSYFDLTYIELIGIENEKKFQEAANKSYSLHASYKENRRRDGLTRFAVRTTTIEEDAKLFARAGLDVVGPERFSRKRDDGTVVSWQLLYIGHPKSKIEFPFFIQWDEADSLRRKELTDRGIIAKHPLGDLAIQAVHFVVPNFDAVEQIAQLCGATILKKVNQEENVEYSIILLDEVKLIFVKPIGEGAAWNYMLENGYGIKKVVLTGAKEQKQITIDGAQYEINKK